VKPRTTFATGAALALFSLAVAAAHAQERPEAGSRQLWDEDFVRSRPDAPKARPSARPARPPAAARPEASYVGVTLWRLKPASGSRGVVLTGEGRTWEAERAEVDAALPEGQPVRMTVESSRPGYLYVIDRERYADGTLGTPVLVFPTLRLRGGDNEVEGGKVIEIPDLGDKPPYLTLKKSRADQVEEQLLLLVAPAPIEGLAIGQDARPLTAEQVAEWEKKWGGQHTRLETAGGAGRAYSAAEHAAGTGGARRLARDEPLPQTLYRLGGRGGTPALVTVALRLAP
jgi:hypothetical protein